MTTLTKWFLLNAIVLTGLFFAEAKGVISLMIKNDVSYLTVVIIALYALMSAFVGKLCCLADKIKKGKEAEARVHLFRRSEVGWFAAEHFFSLGLLGTIIGLCVATSTSLNEGSEINDIVSGLKTGLNTAFYTTICGIVFSLALQAQLMVLKFKLDDDK